MAVFVGQSFAEDVVTTIIKEMALITSPRFYWRKKQIYLLWAFDYVHMLVTHGERGYHQCLTDGVNYQLTVLLT